jgi:tetratricopeptide (TPR) repeat protein
MVRLDRLEPVVKEVAQISAAIGREFTHELLVLVGRLTLDQIQGALEKLWEAGLIFPRAGFSDASFVFKHALVRDVVYESCLKSKRKLLHLRIANAVVSQTSSADTAATETAAGHFLAAEELTQALPNILATAVGYGRRYAYVEALRWFERGAEVIRQLPVDQATKRIEFELYVAWTPVLMGAKGYADAQTLAVAERADLLSQELGQLDRLVPALFGKLSYYSAGGGTLNQALNIATRIRRYGESSGHPVALLVGKRTEGFCNFFIGYLPAAESALESALTHSNEVPDDLALQFGQDPKITALALLGAVKQRMGNLKRGGAMLRAARKKARTLGHPVTHAYVLHHSINLAALLMDIGQVETLAVELTDVCSKYEIGNWELFGPFMKKWSLVATFHRADDVSALVVLFEQLQSRAFRLNLPFYGMLVAESLLTKGELAMARAILDKGLELARARSETWIEPDLLRAKARLNLAEGEGLEEAEEMLILSHQIAQTQGAKVAQLRAATDLARLWRDEGRDAEAHALLAPIYGWFTEGFAMPDLREAKALVEELS